MFFKVGTSCFSLIGVLLCEFFNFCLSQENMSYSHMGQVLNSYGLSREDQKLDATLVYVIFSLFSILSSSHRSE